GGISPGSTLAAGNYRANVYGVSGTFTPSTRWYCSGSFVYSDSRITTAAEPQTGTVVPYDGSVYSVSAAVGCTLNVKTVVQASYAWSRAGYGQNNVAQGLPLGLDYTRHSLTVGLSRKLKPWLTSNVRYSFFQYDEPNFGGANGYTAHGVFATLGVRWM